MRIKSIVIVCLSAPAFWVAMSLPSLAVPICWIDHIAKAQGGVDVYFSRNASLRIGVKGDSGETSFRHTALNGVVRDEGGREQDHLFVKDGVEFYASQLSHDPCSYKVSASGEVGRLTAQAAMHLPGLAPVFRAEIIGTDGSVSPTQAASSGP